MLSEKPWKPEAVLFLFGGVFFCVLAGALLSSGLYPKAAASGQVTLGRVAIAILSFQGAALVLVGFFLRYHRIRWRDAFGFGHRWLTSTLVGWICAVCFLPVGWALQWLSVQVLLQMSQTPSEQEVVQALRDVQTWAQRLGMMVIAIILVPIVEEMLFRGILYPLVKQAGFPRAAFWGVSLFFAAMHFSAVNFLPLFALSLLLTLLYEYSDNLLAPIAAHSLFNALNFALFYLVKDAG